MGSTIPLIQVVSTTKIVDTTTHSTDLQSGHVATLTDHLEGGSHVLEHLGGIFTQIAQLTATAGAGRVVWQVSVDFAWKMFRKGTAVGLGRSRTLFDRDGLRFFARLRSLKFFQLQFQLFDLTKHLLALLAEQHMLQLLDQ